MNVWEIPALLKTNITLGHVRPFIDFGVSLRHISTIKTGASFAGVANGTTLDNAAELHNRNSYAGVAGIGITFKKGPFELSPEARYTRWAIQSFQAPACERISIRAMCCWGSAFDPPESYVLIRV